MSEFHSSVSPAPCSPASPPPASCSSAPCNSASTDLETLKAEFITAFSHDIRTPLSIILLAVELLRLQGTNCTEAQQQAYLGQIYCAAQQINQQLNVALGTIGADPA